MSQPNSTSQKPNPLSATPKNLSREMYLPRPTPSISKPISRTLLICRSSNSFRSPSTVIRARLPPDCPAQLLLLFVAQRIGAFQLEQLFSSRSRGHNHSRHRQAGETK